MTICACSSGKDIVAASKKDSSISDIRVFETLDNHSEWKIISSTASLNENTGIITFEKPKFDIYENDKMTSRILSRQARLNLKTRDTVMTGNVIVDSKKENSVLKTEKLSFSSKMNKIWTKEKVAIYRQDSVTRGTELKANPDLSQIEIKNQKTTVLKGIQKKR